MFTESKWHFASFFVTCRDKNHQIMAIEIERKFLVSGEYKHLAVHAYRVKQGYLCHIPGKTIRVRVRDDQGFLTIKGPGSASGMSRFEWEIEIPVSDAEQLMALCEGIIVDKVRYIIPYEGHTFEVDEFHGVHEGLTIAEVELTSESESFSRPSFLGAEVTGDKRYYNSYLSLSGR